MHAARSRPVSTQFCAIHPSSSPTPPLHHFHFMHRMHSYCSTSTRPCLSPILSLCRRHRRMVATAVLTSSDNERKNSSCHCSMHSMLARATAAACVYIACRTRCTTAASLEARGATAVTQSHRSDHMALRACTAHQHTYIHKYVHKHACVYTHRNRTRSV